MGANLPQRGEEPQFTSSGMSEPVARALVSGHLDALMNHSDRIAKLDAEQVRRLADLAIATRMSCGGNNCG